MVVAATGFFDGLHLGHRAVLGQLCDLAKKLGGESAVVTFWPHPRTVLQQDAGSLRLLTTLEEKRQLLKEMGVDHCFVVPFTPEFSHLTSAEFMQQYLQEQFGVKVLLLGYDHRLGSDANQTPQILAEKAKALGLEPIIVERTDAQGDGVSSTRIRNLLLAGDLSMANNLLGRPYQLKGVVVAGNRIGRTLGFPTANMQLYEPLKLVPANGVYCVEAIFRGKTYAGLCNIGSRPTVGKGNAVTIETHILDFEEEIYGLDLELNFLERVRSEQHFPSLEHLRQQMVLDLEFARQYFTFVGSNKEK